MEGTKCSGSSGQMRLRERQLAESKIEPTNQYQINMPPRNLSNADPSRGQPHWLAGWLSAKLPSFLWRAHTRTSPGAQISLEENI